MILLDTNVISPFMAPSSDTTIVGWLNTQDRESLWITSITVFEVRTGIDLLPLSRRRQRLEDAFARALDVAFAGRIAFFDDAAAQASGRLAAARRTIGRPVEIRDLQIAGIAIARNAMLATRNTHHFEDLGVDLIDPWAA